MAKAIISTTYSDTYLYFLPITVFCWNKLNVDVICFMPYLKDGIDGYNPDKEKREKYGLIIDTLDGLGIELQAAPFSAPEHKEATYAQCSRLYGACLDLPEDEVLITGDVDMAMFKNIFSPNIHGSYLTVIGNDLVPDGQYPICYCYGTVKSWRESMELSGKSYQQCLDDLLGDIECESFRGNYWGKDQETLFNELQNDPKWVVPRSNGQNQFAQNRVDRDDTNWRAYVNDELVDAHLWRDGFTDGNFENILELLTMKFPDDNFSWLENYTQKYKELL